MTSIGDSWEEVKNELFSNEEIIEIMESLGITEDEINSANDPEIE